MYKYVKIDGMIVPVAQPVEPRQISNREQELYDRLDKQIERYRFERALGAK